jgi:hypothetical protein
MSRRRTPRMPTEDELRALQESRRTWGGKPLSTDPRNVYQRSWYRRKHPRACADCGAEIGPWQRRCMHCWLRNENEAKAR